MANFVITSLCSSQLTGFASSALFESNHAYRSDMNAGISAHFSPTIKSERDTWLRFVHTHRTNLSERKVCGGSVFKSISRRNVFQGRFTWKAVVVGLFPAHFLQYGRSSQGNNLPNDNTAT